MTRSIFYIFLITTFSCLADADINCDEIINDEFGKVLCAEQDLLRQIEEIQLHYFGYLIEENPQPNCIAEQFFYLLRKQYSQYIDYSISTCEKESYIDDSLYTDNYNGFFCQSAWIPSYLQALKAQSWAGNNICTLPPIEEIDHTELESIVPSFDCENAGTRVERTICSDYKTKLYDRYLVFLYELGISWNLQNLREEQENWLETDRCNSLSRSQDVSDSWLLNCLKASYEDRIISIENSLFVLGKRTVSRRFSTY